MSTIEPDHLRQTLAHPLLETLFTDYCGNDNVSSRALQFWNNVNDLQCVGDSNWIRIFSTALFRDFLADKKLNISEGVFTQIKSQIDQKRFSTKMFAAAQQEVFSSILSNSLRKFLQSDVYHREFENLRKGALFICLCDCTGLQATLGHIYCTITVKENIITSSLTSPQSNTWDEEGITHRMEFIPNPDGKVIIAIYLQNQSCWQGDDLIGTVSIPMSEIWDEIPKLGWYQVDVPSDRFSVKLKLGIALMHHPSYGASISKVDFSNPLATSGSNGHYGAVDKLISNGHNIDDRVEGTNRTALHLAVMKNRSNIVQLLLYRKADPNLVDSHSQTALHLAAQFSPNLCHMLISSGARLEVKELFNNGQTALHMLASHNYADALQYLIDSNANINAQTMDGITPLHKAVSQNSVAAVKTLVRAGAKLDISDDRGKTPFALAEEQKSIRGKEILKFMREYKVLYLFFF